jgi:7,8-dihydropterin-6-yl-methyl-4-(beta-D-ribofuranosyl)aminobenzene 5'-phosphate synthase
VYDNNPLKPGLQTAWGFSCLVETGKTQVLFDTGGEGKILLANLQTLGIDPAEIDLMVLSHIHYDHTGGMADFLKKNSQLKVYVPASFPEKIIEDIKATGATPATVSASVELQPNIFTLGEIGGAVPEQSLAVRTPKGMVIITGCAHPGILTVLHRAKSIFPDDQLYLVIGGFHLVNANKKQISEIIDGFKTLGVQKAAPCHCSGDETRRMFSEAYQNDFYEIGVGGIIDIDTRRTENKP